MVKKIETEKLDTSLQAEVDIIMTQVRGLQNNETSLATHISEIQTKISEFQTENSALKAEKLI